EYVWHCHILGHEENDFMRPFIFHAQEVLAPAFNVNSATASGSGITISWTDPTPVPALLTAYDVITNPTGFLGNPNNEIGFRVDRADVINNVPGTYVPVSAGLHTINPITAPVNAPANATSYVDPVVTTGSALPTPAAPTVLAQTASSVTLVLPPLPASATGYDVYRNGGATPLAANQPAGNFVDNGVSPGNTYSYTIMAVLAANAAVTGYSYRVVAVTAAGETLSSNSLTVNSVPPSNSALSTAATVVMLAAQPAGVTVSNPTVNSLTVNWPASPGAQQVTGYLVSMNGGAAVAASSPDLVGGLAPNTGYSFTVAAVNAAGTSAPSAPATGTTLPAAPTQLTVGTITSSSVALSWTAPANAAGLTYTVGGVPGAATVAYNGTSALVSGLGPNTAYTFSVVARNVSGPGAASNAASALTLPAAPAGLTASAVSPTSVTLAWTASLNGAATYTVQYSADNGASWTALPPLAGLGTTVNGLLPSTTYLFQVTAANATGASTPSGQASATTPATTVPPGVPTCCTASSATSSSVVLNWIAPATGPATSYTVQRATNASFTRGLQTVLNVVGTSVPFTGLSLNVTYYFHVMAVNAVGSSAYSATFSFQPPAPPPPPAAPTATAAPVSTAAPTIALSFAAPAAGVTYTVYQQSRTGGGGAWGTATAVATGVTGTGWTSPALQPDLQYRYYLVAVNVAGTSANGASSNTVTARQLANAPTGLAATNVTPVTPGVGRRSVTLNWALGSPDGATVTAIRLVRANGSTLTGGLTTTNLGATAVTSTVTGLNRNATYTFQVQAVTAGGVNGSTTVTITTLP
ncbi:MAG TPA: fibronectin type III domain-containing protein, partial [Steroidobacteraceae bacterium]|nr:fibronectin type III domain-containing protein [Steroidobacteraceae bacterium]